MMSNNISALIGLAEDVRSMLLIKYNTEQSKSKNVIQKLHLPVKCGHIEIWIVNNII